MGRSPHGYVLIEGFGPGSVFTLSDNSGSVSPATSSASLLLPAPSDVQHLSAHQWPNESSTIFNPSRRSSVGVHSRMVMKSKQMPATTSMQHITLRDIHVPSKSSLDMEPEGLRIGKYRY